MKIKKHIQTQLETFLKFTGEQLSLDHIFSCLANRVPHDFMKTYDDIFDQIDSLSLDTRMSCAQKLKPWTKGPFNIETCDIDAEWDCSLKWNRLAPFVSDFQQKSVLDIGCGNGYYLFQLADSDPGFVVGLDPTWHYFSQYLFLQKVKAYSRVAMLPLQLQELNSVYLFDSVLCLGVLYHVSDPLSFLKQCRSTVKRKGAFFLETLIYPGTDPIAYVPRKHYAGMKNITFLPTQSCLEVWLDQAGFQNIQVCDLSITTSEEQRVTPWSRPVSLSHFIDPNDRALTTEGLPRPCRILIRCQRK